MTGHRVAARAAAALVAVVAGAASFEHIASVAMGAGERPWVAWSLPLAIDGLIVVGVAALLEDRRSGLRPRPVARLAVAVGVVATLAANIASAEPTTTARLVAIAAPVAFLLSVEVLTRSGRPMRKPAQPVAPDRSATRTATGKRGSGHGRTRRGQGAARVAAAVEAAPGAPVAELARVAKVSRSTVRRHLTGQINGQPVPDLVASQSTGSTD